jgi:hypothetical protein
VLAIVSTPRHMKKLSGRYLSDAPLFAPVFRERVREVTHDAPFWRPAGP